MKFLKRFILLILVLVLALIGIGYELPDSAHVERSVRIDASPQTVFTYVSDFRKFNEWSPWAQKDPNMKYTFGGPESGVGATMTWHSDDPDVGSGSSLITQSKPPHHLATRLEFGPEATTATSYFNITPVTSGSKVTWGFDTEFGSNLIWRYFGLMMDRWVGGEFDKGLDNLKTLVEKEKKDA